MANKEESEPSPSEHGDALRMLKVFAYEGFVSIVGGTKEEFEEMWRTAFYLENVDVQKIVP